MRNRHLVNTTWITRSTPTSVTLSDNSPGRVCGPSSTGENMYYPVTDYIALALIISFEVYWQ
ncbi:hypothetical protein EO856_15765 [Shigella flexneri]|nr:hypothetical protein MC63_002075 [Shigella flexneri]EFN9737209.1 hypothetical protein [Escherichia coli]EAB1248164.1 hypothetical protein [Shigella flexneri]EFX0996910.1 hypothetical protein [Shigella flexneri]EFX1062888.1 hypothetical protein [Shigella flexneri]